MQTGFTPPGRRLAAGLVIGVLCAAGCRLLTDTDSVRPNGDNSDYDAAPAIECSEDNPCPTGFECSGDQCTAIEVAAVALGSQHTCALFDDGRVTCWGANDKGQLGYGDTEDRGDTPDTTPSTLPAVDLPRAATEIAAAGDRTCALLDDGSLYCWGDNCGPDNPCRGMLGQGDTRANSLVPIAVDLGAPVGRITMGRYHSCARLEPLTQMRCWGGNSRGQLGTGDLAAVGDGEVPASVTALQFEDPVIDVAIGNFHSCVLLGDRGVRCWGDGATGRLGTGTTADLLTPPTDAISLGSSPVALVAGNAHTCAIVDSGGLRCWGANLDGRLGLGNLEPVGDNEPVSDVDMVEVGGRVEIASAGIAISCALLTSGEVRCWGANTLGQLGVPEFGEPALGDDELPNSIAAIELSQPAEDVVGLETGDQHTCAIIDPGAQLRCWGAGARGRLGTGSDQDVGDDEDPVDSTVPLYPTP